MDRFLKIISAYSPFSTIKSALVGIKAIGRGRSKLKQDHGFKMLLIGETGSGKTSFLNLLWNNGKICELGYEVHQLDRFNDIKLENAQAKKMESKTVSTKMYNVVLCDLEIGIIDSPGFGDSRGMEEDKKHTRTIVEALKSEEYINCICLVINGRAARMTATLRYVLTEITAILPRVVLKNVIVVLTNTSNPLLCNFDPAGLNDFFGEEIDEKRIFYIENPYCHLEKAKEKKNSLSHNTIVSGLKSAFEEASATLKKMHEAIKKFKQIHTQHFIQLYETKQEIERKVLVLLTEYDNQMEFEKDIAIAKERVTRASRSKQLHADYKSTQEVKRWITVSTEKHNTLCGAPGCHRNCHVPCHLDKSYDKEVFRYCACMNGGVTCIICGHSYKLHYHNEVKFEQVVEQVELIDNESKKIFEEAESMEKREQILIDSINEKQEKSKQKREELSDQLLSTIEDFQKLGVSQNYVKVLENQLVVVEHRLEGATGDEAKHLREMKQKMEKQLKCVKDGLKKKLSQGANPEAKIVQIQSRPRGCPSSDVELSEGGHSGKESKDSNQYKINVTTRDVFVGWQYNGDIYLPMVLTALFLCAIAIIVYQLKW